MANPYFDEFSLQDDNYVTQNIEYRTMPGRSTDTAKISRRPGLKLLSDDFVERKVKISGSIVGSSISDLQEKIDSFHENITRKDTGLLQIEDNRIGTAVVTSVVIPDPHYTQSYVPFEIDFLMTDPFWYGPQQIVTWDVPAASFSQSYSMTVSGTIFSEPSITYTAPDGGGQTTTSGVIIEYSATSEKTTWSGTGATTTLAYGSSVTFDFKHHRILEDTEEVDVEGVFSRWHPGPTSFTVTFSGTAAGGELQFAYQPRYL